ncbi:hypothetical protein EXW85_26150 [Klebsiella pneumoniae]|nr:hypothetical protein [Klebsiella pneumoniae]OVG24862.1 hypothetical protein B5L85_08050 [Klebsiella pneumoniae]SYE94212.1 Uncharacterised protein [Klebsiella pneumoniae]SYF20556.1 Uncharacterised protein [Klebsiella pneumoniae]
MMSLWDALRMNMMISYQELVRTFPKTKDKKKLTLITIKRLWFGEKFYLTGGFKIHLCQKVNFLYFS